MNSAQLADVEEITPMRRFKVQGEIVTHDDQGDHLWCSRCESYDNCPHTALVRLCGILTNTLSVPNNKPRLALER